MEVGNEVKIRALEDLLKSVVSFRNQIGAVSYSHPDSLEFRNKKMKQISYLYNSVIKLKSGVHLGHFPLSKFKELIGFIESDYWF